MHRNNMRVIQSPLRLGLLAAVGRDLEDDTLAA
jgi:hypothetical protein